MSLRNTCHFDFTGKGGQLGPVCFARYEHHKRVLANFVIFSSVLVLLATVAPAQAKTLESPEHSSSALDHPIVVTQFPVGTTAERQGPLADGMLRADFGDRARLVILYPDLSTKVVSRGFHSACDPDVSFDGSRVVFAGKRKAEDEWHIFEIGIDGSSLRQVTGGPGGFRSPGYQSSLYTLKPVGVPSVPEYHLTFVACTGAVNEYGGSPATSLYSCKLDGSVIRRLTFNLSSDMDPFMQADGQLLFASWQRSNLNYGPFGRIALFGVNIDGTDYAAFSTDQGKRIRHMPCTTTKGLAVFVEADRIPWDGAGTLGSVRLRRPLHSHRPITTESDGLFHSPSPLADGRILVSRRPADGGDTHGLGRLDPVSGQFELIFDDSDYHDIQAKAVYPRPEPDGRSSVVGESHTTGRLYCLNVYTSDLSGSARMPRGTVKRLRVVEGIPRAENSPGAGEPGNAKTAEQSRNGFPTLAQRRILGEINVHKDGSFNIEVPANTPIELQTLDADGMALRTCSWIWVKNREPRGCIGCHEDGERTPENVFVEAVTLPSIKLTLPAEQRRTVDFRRDVMPIITEKCAHCHDKPDARPRLTPDITPSARPGGKGRVNRSYESLLARTNAPVLWRYVHPGHARRSPLVWRLFGRNTSRPWDSTFSQKPVRQMPPDKSPALTEDEKRTFVEWIDLGALWDNIAGADNLSANKNQPEGSKK